MMNENSSIPMPFISSLRLRDPDPQIRRGLVLRIFGLLMEIQSQRTFNHRQLLSW